MRSGLDSMTPGKAIAQGSHATNDFENSIKYATNNKKVITGYTHWIEDRTFGRCLTLAIPSLIKLDGIMGKLEELDFLTSEVLFGEIVDPTYPIRDGNTTHHIELKTCGWVFVHDKMSPSTVRSIENILKEYDLY